MAQKKQYVKYSYHGTFNFVLCYGTLFYVITVCSKQKSRHNHKQKSSQHIARYYEKEKTACASTIFMPIQLPYYICQQKLRLFVAANKKSKCEMIIAIYDWDLDYYLKLKMLLIT